MSERHRRQVDYDAWRDRTENPGHRPLGRQWRVERDRGSDTIRGRAAMAHVLLARYREHGEAGLEPRSRRPRSSPSHDLRGNPRTDSYNLRDTLVSSGREMAPAPSPSPPYAKGVASAPATSTIWRILTLPGGVTPQPQKRPRSSLESGSSRPSPTRLWQSDFTHVPSRDGTEVEVIAWRDDHSRFLRHLTCSPQGHRQHRDRHVHRRRGTSTGYPAIHPDRQRHGLHHTIRPRRAGPRRRLPQSLRDLPRPARHDPEERETRHTHKRKARSRRFQQTLISGSSGNPPRPASPR